MGSAASKQQRTLSKTLKQPIQNIKRQTGVTEQLNKNANQTVPRAGAAGHGGPGDASKRPVEPINGEDQMIADKQVADRLKQLGAITTNYMDMQKMYGNSKTNDDMLKVVKKRHDVDIQAKEMLESQDLEPNAPKKLLNAETVSAILQSRKSGRSADEIVADYNLADGVLEKIGLRFSVAEARAPRKHEEQEEKSDVQDGRRKPIDNEDETGEVLDR